MRGKAEGQPPPTRLDFPSFPLFPLALPHFEFCLFIRLEPREVISAARKSVKEKKKGYAFASKMNTLGEKVRLETPALHRPSFLIETRRLMWTDAKDLKVSLRISHCI